MTDWPDSQNNEPDQVETEWKLLQVNSAAKDELQGGADDMGDGSETVTRRYEFYRYAAAADTLDGENNEAMCSEVNPTTDQGHADRQAGEETCFLGWTGASSR